MPDNQAVEIQLIKAIYSKYQQEMINIEGVYIRAQFNGLSDLVNLELKEKPFSTKMLVADIQFVAKSLEVSNNINENKVKNIVIAKLEQFPHILEGINGYIKDNQHLAEQLAIYLEKIQIIGEPNKEIRSNMIFRNTSLVYSSEEVESQIVIDDVKSLQIELLNKLTQSNKSFLLSLSKQILNVEPKEAIIKMLLGKILTDTKGCLILLKVFKV